MKNRELGFIHILKHGFQILSPVNWASFPQFHIVAGVLGFTGFILAIRRDGSRTGGCLRLLSTSEKRVSSEKSLFVPGLQNLGNNCFLNVVLQALASCACFHPFLQNLIEKDGYSADERVESMPLTVALISLFAVCCNSFNYSEFGKSLIGWILTVRDLWNLLDGLSENFCLSELCNPSDESLTLSPRKVMLAMDYYIPNFNLTRQQDAAEAFLHLLSSLKEEVSECYVPHYSSLADIFTFPQSKIPDPDRREGFEEQERWRQHFLGPFNGILGSTLTCKSCSSELSMDFEFFHSLPLSPLLDGETIIDGCSMEDCLKLFTAAEHIENYRCNRCWHAAAIKYLSTKGQEVQIEKLKSCVEEDSCDCKSIFPREGLPWSNAVSRTFKQLRIARCPKILCIQLQRASVNRFGELIKLQGHISFPMVLDLFPFTTAAVGVGIEKFEENVGRMRVNQHQNPVNLFNNVNMQFPTHMLQQIYGSTRNNMDITVETLVEEEACNIINNEGDKHARPFVAEPALDHSENCSCPKFTGSRLSDNKINNSCHLVPLQSCMYHLVSVVEHSGRVGSGHYTVYRRLRESDGAGSFGQFGSSQGRWFCVSDTDVSSASVKDALAAHASLLFYELEEST